MSQVKIAGVISRIHVTATTVTMKLMGDDTIYVMTNKATRDYGVEAHRKAAALTLASPGDVIEAKCWERKGHMTHDLEMTFFKNSTLKMETSDYGDCL